MTLLLKSSACALLLAISSLPQTHGNDHAMPGGLPLHPTSTVAIPTEPNRPVYKPPRCDAHGNIYFRAYQADDRRVPVVRADAKGSTIKYSLDADPLFANATSYDFSVLPDGSLYQPVQMREDVYIVAFDHQGKIRRKTKLEKQFWVGRLTALSEQSFLVIGTESQGGKQPPQPVTAIFDGDGRLVRNVNLEVGAPVLALLSSIGQVTAGGNAYLLLPTNPVVVYSLDGSGKTKQVFKISAPGPRMTPISMHAVNGRLAILFRESFRGMQHNDMGTILVVDAATGAEISRYTAASKPGTTLACSTPDGFVFVGSDADKLALQYTSAK